MDHDRLFKELLTTCFVEFLELFLPELAAELDPTSVVFLDKEVFTDVISGERHEVDVLARARFRGRDSCFLVHVENQAQEQSGFAARMFGYFARLHEKFRLPIYPIAVFSHPSQRSEPDTYEVMVEGFEVVRFRFRVIQLRRLSWRTFVRQANPVAAALMSCMGMAPAERPRVKLECLRLLTTLRLDPARQRLISGFVDSYLKLNTEETLQFAQQTDTVLSQNEKEQVMELTTSWKEEGREEGRQEGRQQGRQEGEANLILRQLKRRFGDLAPAVEERVLGLPVARLETLAEALLEFESAADLERWLQTE